MLRNSDIKIYFLLQILQGAWIESFVEIGTLNNDFTWEFYKMHKELPKTIFV